MEGRWDEGRTLKFIAQERGSEREREREGVRGKDRGGVRERERAREGGADGGSEREWVEREGGERERETDG